MVAGHAAPAPELHLLLRRFSQIGDAAWDQTTTWERRFNGVPKVDFGTCQIMRRLEHAIWQDLQSFHRPGNAGKAFDIIIPWFDVGISHRPIHAMSVSLVRREIDFRHAVALAPPHDRTPAFMITAQPPEIGAICGFIRMFFVFHPELARKGLKRIDLRLDGIIFAVLIRFSIQVLH